MRTNDHQSQSMITPETALKILEDGNIRFVNNLKYNRNLLQQVNETSEGQWPFAVILSCIDSRTSVELIFDQGLGDVFSIRVAGNIVNEDILGSMEFACKLVSSKFILVLGHTKCGAIKGACDHLVMGNLTSLLNKLQPAVDDEAITKEDRNSANPQFVENVAAINVHRVVNEIIERSQILSDMIANGEIGICGAMYNLETGVVDFYNETMIINKKQSVSDAVV